MSLTNAEMAMAWGPFNPPADTDKERIMKYGVNSGPPNAGMWETIREATGPFSGYRCYSTPAQGIPADWPAWPNRPLGVGFVIASIKPDVPSVINGSLDDALRKWVSGAEAGDYATLWHEGETNEGWTPDQIKTMHRHAHAVIKAARPDIHYGQIVSAYTANPYSSFHPLEQWVARNMDFHGIDGYRPSPKASVASTFEAARRAIVAIAPKARVTVCEVNSINPGRAQFIHLVYAWAQFHKCPTFFPFFFPEGAEGLYDWDPNDAATIAEMKDEIQA